MSNRGPVLCSADHDGLSASGDHCPGLPLGTRCAVSLQQRGCGRGRAASRAVSGPYPALPCLRTCLLLGNLFSLLCPWAQHDQVLVRPLSGTSIHQDQLALLLVGPG